MIGAAATIVAKFRMRDFELESEAFSIGLKLDSLKRNPLLLQEWIDSARFDSAIHAVYDDLRDDPDAYAFDKVRWPVLNSISS